MIRQNLVERPVGIRLEDYSFGLQLTLDWLLLPAVDVGIGQAALLPNHQDMFVLMVVVDDCCLRVDCYYRSVVGCCRSGVAMIDMMDHLE